MQYKCVENGMRIFNYLISIKSKQRLTDLKLSLYPSLTPFPVIGLRSIVLGHNLDEFPRQRRVLSLAYPQICRGFVRVLLRLNVLFYHCTEKNKIHCFTHFIILHLFFSCTI